MLGAFDIANANSITLILDMQYIIVELCHINGYNKSSSKTNPAVVAKWYESSGFRTLFGRNYYKLSFHNPLLSDSFENIFPQFISDTVQGDTLFWFDLNFLGYAFQVKEAQEGKKYYNVDEMLTYKGLEEFLDKIYDNFKCKKSSFRSTIWTCSQPSDLLYLCLGRQLTTVLI